MYTRLSSELFHRRTSECRDCTASCRNIRTTRTVSNTPSPGNKFQAAHRTNYCHSISRGQTVISAEQCLRNICNGCKHTPTTRNTRRRRASSFCGESRLGSIRSRFCRTKRIHNRSDYTTSGERCHHSTWTSLRHTFGFHRRSRCRSNSSSRSHRQRHQQTGAQRRPR